MNDTKILSAIRALHERFVEEPTERASEHLGEFIDRSEFDATPLAWEHLKRYRHQIRVARAYGFSPASLTHLNEVAKECLG